MTTPADPRRYLSLVKPAKTSITRRARWLDAAESTALALLLVVAVGALCLAIAFSPLVLLAAHVRACVTP